MNSLMLVTPREGRPAISSNTAWRQVADHGVKAVVDRSFAACAPCKMVQNFVEALAFFLKTEIDDGRRAATRGRDRAGEIVVGRGRALGRRIQVRVRVHSARKHVSVGRVDDAHVVRGVEVFTDAYDAFTVDLDIRLVGVRGSNQRAVLDEQMHPV